MKLRRLEARVRRSPRRRVKDPDNGNKPAERASQAKSRRGKSSKYIFPKLLNPRVDPSKSLLQGRTRPTKTSPLSEKEDTTCSSGNGQDHCHADAAVEDSLIGDDDDDHCVDMDDLSSIDSDDLDRLLGDHSRCCSNMLIPDPACQADLISIGVCNTSTYEPEGALGVSAGAHAPSSRDSIMVPPPEETSSQRGVGHASPEAPSACSSSRDVPIDLKDSMIMMPEAPEQNIHSSPVIEVSRETLNDGSEYGSAALRAASAEIPEPLSSSAGIRKQSMAFQDGPIPAKNLTTVVESTSEDADGVKMDIVSATACEGNSQDSESTCPSSRSLEQYGVREMCSIQPTVFEEQYMTYQRSRNGTEVECHTVVHRYEVQALIS